MQSLHPRSGARHSPQPAGLSTLGVIKTVVAAAALAVIVAAGWPMPAVPTTLLGAALLAWILVSFAGEVPP